MNIQNEIIKNSTWSGWLKDYVESENQRRLRIQKLYKEYKGKVAVLERTMDDPLKKNNRLPNDYRGLIVDQCVGYLFGNPVTYTIEGDYPDHIRERVGTYFSRWINQQSTDDLDYTTGKYMAVCGVAYRLAYINTKGMESVCHVDPWECNVIKDGRTGLPQYGVRFYTVTETYNGTNYELIQAEVYDEKTIYLLKQNPEKDFIMQEGYPKPHGFVGVPLIEYENNDEQMGDFEKVAKLIDAMDYTLSDVQNEIEEFRNAYMVLKGAEVDEDDLQSIRQTGAIQIPPDADVSFLTKQIDDAFIENHKKTLNEHIYKFSHSVDMGDDKFSGGSQSGESRKYKLLPLENKAKTKERKFVKANRDMFACLASVWQVKGMPVDPLDISMQFTRNLPIELKSEAEMVDKLAGHISQETLFTLLSFISDPQKEKDMILKEKMDEPVIDLDEFEEVDGDGVNPYDPD